MKYLALFFYLLVQLKMVSQIKKDTIYNIDINNSNKYDFLDELVKDKKVIALGEYSHWDGSTFIHKTEIIKYLHEKHGFNIIAFESAFDQIEITNLYNPLYNNIDSVKSQLFPHWKNVKEMQALFGYMKNENMILTGFDSQHYNNTCNIPDSISKYFSNELERINSNVNFKNTLNILLNNFGKSHTMIPTENKKEFIITLNNLINEARKSVEKSLIIDFWIQELISIKGNAVSSWSLPNYMLAINIRDEYMSKNLLWLINTKYKNQKIIVWAQSAHTCRNRFEIASKKEKIYTATHYLADYLYDDLKDNLYTIAFIYNNRNHKKNRSKASLEFQLGLNHEYAFIETIANKEYKINGFYDIKEGAATKYSNWNSICDGFYFINDMIPSTRIVK